MFITKRYVFHYDTSKAAWKNHTKLLAHDSIECSGYFLEDDDEPHDLVEVKFDDGFKAMVYMDELKEIK